MELFVGNDIGNSETKTIVNDTIIKQPSVIKKLLKKPDFTEVNEQKNISNLLDELVVHVSSDAIRRDGLYFVGKRANVTADKVENINIKLGNKHKHDIPVVMTLSMLSARAIQLHYNENKEIPSTLDLDIEMVTAIPASEYSKEKAEQLENRFTHNPHLVTVYVGDKTVVVKLSFNFVKVTQEGVPALYAFLESDEDILENYRKLYPNDNSMPKDLRDKKILHLDIGDGTSEYIYTVGLNPVIDACSGERRGVGHATEEAMKLLKEHVGGFLNINRQQFISILRDEDNKLHEEAKQFMREARFLQSDLILEDVEEKYTNNAAGNVDIIAVYGGGSIQFKPELLDPLLEFAETVKCKVLWVPEKYAVDMNARGMGILMKNVFSKQR